MHLFLEHLTQRFAIAPHARKQHHRIMHATTERRANQNPQCPGQITKLRRQHRTHQWPWPRDRCKVMTKHHPLRCRHEVLAIRTGMRRRRALIIDRQDLRHQPRAVKTIGHRKGANTGHHQPNRIHRFTPLKGRHPHRKGTQKGNYQP